MSSIFTKIIKREIPAFIIVENEDFIAFLDVFPLQLGHVLVVSKLEVDRLYDLPLNILEKLLVFAQPLCRSIEKSVSCKRVGMAVIGVEVAHAHLHLVPIINDANDLNFVNPKLKVSSESLKEMQELLISNLPKN